jgi:hypothetical protein
LHRQGAVATRHPAHERDLLPTRYLDGLAVTEREIEMNRGGGVGIIGVIVIVVVILLLVGVIRL